MSVEFEVPLLKAGIHVAGADLSTHQFKAVKFDANGDIVLCGAGEKAVGILQNDPVLGEACEIEEAGYAKMIYGATVTPAQNLMSNAAGLLIPATATNHIVAVAKHGGALNQVVGGRVLGLAGTILA